MSTKTPPNYEKELAAAEKAVREAAEAAGKAQSAVRAVAEQLLDESAPAELRSRYSDVVAADDELTHARARLAVLADSAGEAGKVLKSVVEIRKGIDFATPRQYAQVTAAADLERAERRKAAEAKAKAAAGAGNRQTGFFGGPLS